MEKYVLSQVEVVQMDVNLDTLSTNAINVCFVIIAPTTRTFIITAVRRLRLCTHISVYENEQKKWVINITNETKMLKT